MGLVTPLVTYNSISINGKSVALSNSCKASFEAPYNKININLTPTNCSLSQYEVRVTQADANYDIGVGQLAYWDTNIENNKAYTFQIDINATNFIYGDGTYRISLYARSSVDGSWDMAYLFFVVEGQFTLDDGSALAVLTTREAPSYE